MLSIEQDRPFECIAASLVIERIEVVHLQRYIKRHGLCSSILYDGDVFDRV